MVCTTCYTLEDAATHWEPNAASHIPGISRVTYIHTYLPTHILTSPPRPAGVYAPAYTGAGVDVYVVDSGIDTLHKEFKPTAGHPRLVQNIYDEYAAVKTKPSANTDDVGHGTHVAGIVGGNNVGVARGANLLGVKVLDSKGATDDSIVIRVRAAHVSCG